MTSSPIPSQPFPPYQRSPAVEMKLTPKEYEELPWLHLYGQYAWHDEATILGTREALTAMRDAIDRALADKNGEAEMDAIAGDGEGYGIQFRRVPRAAVQSARAPYTADYARGKRAAR